MTKFESELLEFNKTVLEKLQKLNAKYEAAIVELNEFKALDKLDAEIEKRLLADGKKKITLIV